MLRPVLPLTNEELAMRHGLRRLDPIDFKTSLEVNKPGPAPEMLDVEIWRLCVNDEYQRDISGTGRNRIKLMAENWDWEKYTPISIVLAEAAAIAEAGTTLYEVVDGQHEAIAAATNGNIVRLPAILKSASTLKEKAASFIGINKRVAIPTSHKFNTELAAGDEVAISVNCALSFSKCRLLDMPPSKAQYEVGDTLAVGTMQIIVRAQGGDALTRILRIAKAGRAAPITAHMLKALAIVINSDDDDLDDKIANYLVAYGAKRIELECKAHCPPGEQVSSYMAEHFFTKLNIRKPAVRGSKARRASRLLA
jgi:hypothetical protein